MSSARDPFQIEIDTISSRPRASKSLEWEESAVDSLSGVEGFSNEDRPAPKVAWVKVITFIFFAVLGVKLFSLQVVQGTKFRELAENNRVRSQVVLAPRGLIRDRDGVSLAENEAGSNLVFTPADLPRDPNQVKDIIAKITAAFGSTEAEVTQKVASSSRLSFEPINVKQDLSAEDGIRFETRAEEFPGFSVRKVPIRRYPDPEVFSHLLGYTGTISPEEHDTAGEDSGYDRSDYVGKNGVELQYERYLHGTNGASQVEVDSRGRMATSLGRLEPEPGQTVYLNIDKEYQLALYNAFKKLNPGGKGAAVVTDIKTGAVLALLSVPGYDINLFAHGIRQGDYDKLLSDKSLPLFNRALAGTYPPGSTVKPMVALAALTEGAVTESTVITDRGVLTVPNQFDPSISYDFVGWKLSGLGPMTVKSAIAESSDIFFYVVTGGHPSSPVKSLGINKLANWYRKFGLGRVTGIDLPGEKPGVVADPDWKAEFFKKNPILSKWYLGDTYHVGIGQGDMLTTPLQVNLWTATIAAGGMGYVPHVVDRVVSKDGTVLFKNVPEVRVPQLPDREAVHVVQAGMRQTVTAGSGRSLVSLAVTSAGKTGTSQFDGSDPSRTHAWYTAYAPYENPEIAVTVLVEAGGEGHSAAVPIVGNFLAWWAKDRVSTSSASSTPQ